MSAATARTIANRSHNLLASRLDRATTAYHADSKNRRLWRDMLHTRNLERAAWKRAERAAHAEIVHRAVNHPRR